jgi:hypothetical protein
VDIPVIVRSSAWVAERRARIVDLSATGARIDGLDAPSKTLLHLTFEGTVRRAKVMRSGSGEEGPWVGVAFVETSRTGLPCSSDGRAVPVRRGPEVALACGPRSGRPLESAR